MNYSCRDAILKCQKSACPPSIDPFQHLLLRELSAASSGDRSASAAKNAPIRFNPAQADFLQRKIRQMNILVYTVTCNILRLMTDSLFKTSLVCSELPLFAVNLEQVRCPIFGSTLILETDGGNKKVG